MAVSKINASFFKNCLCCFSAMGTTLRRYCYVIMLFFYCYSAGTTIYYWVNESIVEDLFIIIGRHPYCLYREWEVPKMG